MSEYKLPKDGLELLSARFLHRVVDEWRGEFDMYERDLLMYLLALTVSRNAPSIKLSVREMVRGIKPKTNPQHWLGVPRLTSSDTPTKHEVKLYLYAFQRLAQLGILTMYQAGGPAATRRHIVLDLTWTPERINA